MKFQILMPVHNEADTIEYTIKEWYESCKQLNLNPTFIISEDGSRDNTLNKINELSEVYEINLITSKNRKGYSRAVVDAILSAEDGIVCCIDSDGQCDPKDLKKFMETLYKQPNVIISGVRSPRNDVLIRKVMSKSFGFLFKVIFKINMKDPSCPFVLGKKSNFDFVSKEIFLEQGFWWEFHARRVQGKVPVAEIKINHRMRQKGVSRVYSVKSIFKIVIKHIFGLFQLKCNLKLH